MPLRSKGSGSVSGTSGGGGNNSQRGTSIQSFRLPGGTVSISFGKDNVNDLHLTGQALAGMSQSDLLNAFFSDTVSLPRPENSRLPFATPKEPPSDSRAGHESHGNGKDDEDWTTPWLNHINIGNGKNEPILEWTVFPRLSGLPRLDGNEDRSLTITFKDETGDHGVVVFGDSSGPSRASLFFEERQGAEDPP